MPYWSRMLNDCKYRNIKLQNAGQSIRLQFGQIKIRRWYLLNWEWDPTTLSNKIIRIGVHSDSSSFGSVDRIFNIKLGNGIYLNRKRPKFLTLMQRRKVWKGHKLDSKFIGQLISSLNYFQLIREVRWLSLCFRLDKGQ